MSNASAYPRPACDDLSTIETRPSENFRRPSHRLSIVNWRAKSVSEGSITHVNVFLGSLTSISEELAASLAENARRCGAQVTMGSLENFDPKQFVGPNSIFRSTSRLAVFVVSTHVAGKPSPNAETFLQWLREAPSTVRQSPVDPAHPSASSEATPKNSLDVSPRRPKAEAVLHRHYSLTDTLLDNLRVNWRRPFRSGETASKSEGLLHGVQYAVFGVGNSIYRTFNATAKYMDTRLHELGAVRICPVGLGDMSKGIEVAYTKWEAQLLQNISRQDGYVVSSISNPARDVSVPSSRASLPCVTLNAGINIAEIVAGSSMEGPVSTDLKKRNPRKYTYNNVISPPTRRGTLDAGAFMPPITSRR